MNLQTRLDRLETDLHATAQRLMTAIVERINREHTIPERRAFCRVAERVQALRAAGVLCPALPTDGDVLTGDVVRLDVSVADKADGERVPATLARCCRQAAAAAVNVH